MRMGRHPALPFRHANAGHVSLRANGESPVERYLVLGIGHESFRVALLMDYGVAGPFGFSTSLLGLDCEALWAFCRVSSPAAEDTISWDFLMGQ